MAHISIIIPVYNAEDCIEELYRRLGASLETITSDYEIIMVEDCGEDQSWEMIEKMAQQDERVKAIQFSRNFGQHSGITAGLDYCDGDWVVVMDCDLQDRPEEIPRLYNKAQEGYDVVLARRGKRNDSPLKRLSSWLFYKIFNYFTDMNYNEQVGNFRIISRKVVLNFRMLGEQHHFFGALVNWLGFPTTSIDVQHGKRFAGESSYDFCKLCKLAINAIISYSYKPLRISVNLGLLLSFASFFYGIYIVIRAILFGTPILGWSSLMVSIYFIGGFIIFNLGIIGVYIGKNLDESKRRPLYVIRRKI